MKFHARCVYKGQKGNTEPFLLLFVIDQSESVCKKTEENCVEKCMEAPCLRIWLVLLILPFCNTHYFLERLSKLRQNLHVSATFAVIRICNENLRFLKVFTTTHVERLHFQQI